MSESLEENSLNIQPSEDGYGPLYHRVYSVDVPVTFGTALSSMQRLQTAMNEFSPQLLARFEKTKGSVGTLQPGDSYLIHITGPWDGPVVVSYSTDKNFGLKTLEGHLEAGEIHFRIAEVTEKVSRFEIESLARSRDIVVDFVYDKIPVAKLAQTEMWQEFCENFADHALKIEQTGEPELQNEKPVVVILTERRDEKTGQWEKI